MLLTKLEAKGFKSFGDRIIINFDKGITGVVGPNGCGKSNVVDAIRWVLGEQKSRMLRSDKMESVIFNGTKSRKPTQMAEASLTFKNTKNLLPTEYSEVTITRRYYRSGESEYLLNGVTCRLKDITNLFLDTGIASNSYAIIELKMVEDILNNKDNSRRGLFEEAAGISKFKLRKKETIKKLKDTDDDLDRVEDLLYEIEKNLKSLERQAKQAIKYESLKAENRNYSIALAKKTVSGRQEEIKRLNQQITAEQDKRTGLQTRILEGEATLEAKKSAQLNKEKTLSSRQKALNEHVNKIRQYESENKIKNERMRYLSSQTEKLRDQLENDKKSNERASFSLEGLQQEFQVLDRLVTEMESDLNAYQAAHEQQKQIANETKEEQQIKNAKVNAIRDEVYQIRKEVEIKQMQLSSLKQELESNQGNSEEQNRSLAEFENKLQELEAVLSEERAAYNELKRKDESLKSGIEALEPEIEVKKKGLSQKSRTLDARKNEYNLTKSMVDNLEGYPQAVVFLKKNTKWTDQAFLLSDIIACDEEYRVAIENYLEGYLNYYVVKRRQDAIDAVNLLSDASKGKANFFINEVFDHAPEVQHRPIPQARPALEIVDVDPQYKALAAHLLRSVYIVEDAQQVNQLVDTYEDCEFITKDGKIIMKPSSVSGGAVGLFEGKRIGRVKNLEKLEKEIKSLNISIDKEEKHLKKLEEELQLLKSKRNTDLLEEKQQLIGRLNEDYVTIKTRKEQFAEMLARDENKREDLLERISQLSSDLEESAPRLKSLEEEQEDRAEELEDLNERLGVENEKASEASRIFNEKNIEFHQKRNQLNTVEQEIKFKEENYQSSKQRIESNKEELKKTEEEVRRLLETQETSEDQLLEMYNEKDTIDAGVNEAEKDYYAIRAQISELEKEIRAFQANREQAGSLLEELQNKLNENKLSLQAVKERLSVEFKVDLDELLESSNKLAEEEFPIEELKKRVDAIKEKIERIGPINPMAKEAYEEIKERHTFITEQKNDLLQAKESLLNTISEIDNVAQESFLKAFHEINTNFQKVFRSLFTEEDQCELRLAEPDNPLESEILIMAQPKGKRPLSINQLSGGEKTLTATSLLFAIYLLKPAPFCIFDEVDAPLDDANIDKFNNIIKDFAHHSQFIIVTHNKRTMAQTDVIYGITMVEQGVSRVVPVDLRELA
ncbi:MAG: chromosome segregation protein SMC [Cyclobacteriaceae bacterium]|nr:chromosome segregation protein SMC [Cyclobacteriaceae bacterium]MCH8516747.1 chromosome segregation protein SMC [Cyclobacteriaceae bacterium]